MVNVVCVMNERITVRKWRESWKILEVELAENSVHVVQFLFQNFDAWMTMKLMDIYCILCV